MNRTIIYSSSFQGCLWLLKKHTKKNGINILDVVKHEKQAAKITYWQTNQIQIHWNYNTTVQSIKATGKKQKKTLPQFHLDFPIPTESQIQTPSSVTSIHLSGTSSLYHRQLSTFFSSFFCVRYDYEIFFLKCVKEAGDRKIRCKFCTQAWVFLNFNIT